MAHNVPFSSGVERIPHAIITEIVSIPLQDSAALATQRVPHFASKVGAVVLINTQLPLARAENPVPGIDLMVERTGRSGLRVIGHKTAPYLPELVQTITLNAARRRVQNPQAAVKSLTN
ncbi:MAG TPA: hypothetical protein VGM43_25625 [Bryobacteraceae bacterium]